MITLAGDRHAGRVGLDILSRIDMQFFAARSPEEYVKKAVALALKQDSLSQIRATMRQRLAASPFCNYKLITGDIEKAYRLMWNNDCQSKIKEKWNNRSDKTHSKNSVRKPSSNKNKHRCVTGRRKAFGMRTGVVSDFRQRFSSELLLNNDPILRNYRQSLLVSL